MIDNLFVPRRKKGMPQNKYPTIQSYNRSNYGFIKRRQVLLRRVGFLTRV